MLRDRAQYLPVHMDASRVIATANERDAIPAPLHSRLTEFQIEAPCAEQRKLILEHEFARLYETHRCDVGLTLNFATAERAVTTEDLDVRTMLRLLRVGFSHALVAEADRVVLSEPPATAGRRRIGFI